MTIAKSLITKTVIIATLILIAISQSSLSSATVKSLCINNYKNKRLIGVWESKETSMGGLGIIMEFREDGGWVDPIGAIVDSPGKFPSQYVGVQKTPGTTGDGYAYINYKADGQTQYREPFPKPWGCYQVIESKLHLCPAGCPPEEVSFKVTDTTLELTNKHGKKQTLYRVEPAWYRPLNENEVEQFLRSFNVRESKKMP